MSDRRCLGTIYKYDFYIKHQNLAIFSKFFSVFSKYTHQNTEKSLTIFCVRKLLDRVLIRIFSCLVLATQEITQSQDHC